MRIAIKDLASVIFWKGPLHSKSSDTPESTMQLLKALAITTLLSTPALAVQGSDSCATPTAIAGQGTFQFNNIGATTGTEGQSETLCAIGAGSAIENDVWFAWTSDFTGLAHITTCGGSADNTKMAAYAGASCPTAGSALNCNDNLPCGAQAAIFISAQAGNTYLIQLGNAPGGAASLPGSFDVIYTQPIQYPANGHYYAAVTSGPISFDTAKAAAESLYHQGVQGHLAVINDFFEGDFLVTNFAERAWIGGYQDVNDPSYSEPGGGWKWITGEPFSYTNWAASEPNDFNGNEEYIEFTSNGEFNDQAITGNNQVWGYYVEFSDTLAPTIFCPGDGTGTPCPCGNSGAAEEGCANGSGSGAKLLLEGTSSISAANLVLTASQLTPSQPGLYFQGNNAINSGSGVQFGDGLRCAGGGVVRLQVRFADATGTSATTSDIGAFGGALPGDVKRYQIWYRDPQGSPCGAQFNLSNGMELVWSA